LWERFFGLLGLRVCVSEPTTRRTVELATAIAEAEHCLPVKLLHAHLAELAGRVDLLFVPRILSTRKGHLSCPKLAILPDVARIELAGKVRILTVEIDAEREDLLASLCRLGRTLGADRLAARRAAENAQLPEAGESRCAGARSSDDQCRPILVISHPYNLFDDYICGPIVRKLERLKVEVRLPQFDGLPVPESFVKWDTSNEMYHLLQELDPAVCRGVIQISSFNCGCDSITLEFYRDVLKAKAIPYMVLIIDEHSAPAGIETRLEAFVDSLGARDDFHCHS
jgi:predicted nucleotide-binding protein (sugar kinase/HSP70/actin superfamily)